MDPLMAAIHHAIAEPIRPKEPYEMAPTDDPVEAAWERFRLAVMRRLEAEEAAADPELIP